MGITPAVIEQKEFTRRFRGFDSDEVELFLWEVAQEIQNLSSTINSIKDENHRLELENQGYRTRENSIQRALIYSEAVIDEMKNSAKKTAEAIIAEAEVEAEKILNRAHHRLSQLHSDISELKRQRMQIEIQISSVIESHSRLLEMSKAENKAAEQNDSTLLFLKQA
ncbi:MAG: DivIVA domain-containing protein [Desulfamplus sp.]|nr:DivIVA domain-containing protein [Desulfamplus sp.]MBF0412510.1 DivIVA domain-containing protein [Desulfamplus sp.]